jgi:hypothetical protein
LFAIDQPLTTTVVLLGIIIIIIFQYHWHRPLKACVRAAATRDIFVLF